MSSPSPSSSTPSPAAKPKRAKASCLACRSRKTKCGALPQSACQFCLQHGIQCEWPSEDLRKTKRPRIQPTDDSTSPVATTSDTTPQQTAGLVVANDATSTWCSDELSRILTGAAPPTSSLPWLSIGDTSLEFPSFGQVSLDNAFVTEPTGTSLSGSWPINGNPLPIDTQQPTVPVVLGANAAAGSVRHIKWLRPHGWTAFSSGITPIYLKLQIGRSQRLTTPGDGSLSDQPRSCPVSTDVLHSLIGTFDKHFGKQYPFLRSQMLYELLDTSGEESFLLNCVATMAANFSQHPAVVKVGVKPCEYGLPWYNKARSMIGMVMAVPLRETIMGFVLLAAIAIATGSASEIWMMAGNAARMATDLGLHLDLTPQLGESSEDAHVNRLVFWNVLLLDSVVSLGLGRPTSFRLEQVTQKYPDHGEGSQGPFDMASRLMFAQCQLINQLNIGGSTSAPDETAINQSTMALIDFYRNIAPNMQWSTTNYRKHHDDGFAPTFLEMHLWSVMLLSLTSRSGATSSNAEWAAQLARSGAMTIVDMINTADAVDYETVLCLPFIGHPLYHAALVLIDEIERLRGVNDLDSILMNDHHRSASLGRSFRLHVLDGKVTAIQGVLERMGRHWRGVSSIATTIEARLSGIQQTALDTDATRATAFTIDEWALPGRYRHEGASVN